jgi:hypothetical protein
MENLKEDSDNKEKMSRMEIIKRLVGKQMPYNPNLDRMIVLFNTVYYDNWFISDTFLVGLHIAIVTILLLPLIAVSYFMVFAYSQYSLRDPRYNIVFDDATEDFWNLPR